MFLTVGEFAEEEGVSASTVRTWIREGLPAKEGPDGILVIDPEVAAEFLDQESEDEEE